MVRAHQEFCPRLAVLLFWSSSVWIIYFNTSTGSMLDPEQTICLHGFYLAGVSWVLSLLNSFVVIESDKGRYLFDIFYCLTKGGFPIAIGRILRTLLSQRELFVVFFATFSAVADLSFDLYLPVKVHSKDNKFRPADLFWFRLAFLIYWTTAAAIIFSNCSTGSMVDAAQTICSYGFLIAVASWMLSLVKNFVVIESKNWQYLFSIFLFVSKAAFPIAVSIILRKFLSNREIFVVILPVYSSLADLSFDVLFHIKEAIKQRALAREEIDEQARDGVSIARIANMVVGNIVLLFLVVLFFYVIFHWESLPDSFIQYLRDLQKAYLSPNKSTNAAGDL